MIRQYIKEKTKTLKSIIISENLKNCKPEDFLIFLASGHFEYDEDGNIKAKINLVDDNKYTCTNNGDGRKIFEGTILDKDVFSLNVPEEKDIKKFLSYEKISVDINAFRWAAGGAIPVVKINGKYYFVMERRSSAAPVHQNHLGTFSGLSETLDEVKNPKLIIMREFYEELLIFDKSFEHRFYALPDHRTYNKDDELRYLDIYGNLEDEKRNNKYTIAYAGLKQKIKKYVNPDPKPINIKTKLKSLGKDSFTIKLINEEKTENNTFLVLDPVHGAVDEIASILIDFDEKENGNLVKDLVKDVGDLRFVFFDHYKAAKNEDADFIIGEKPNESKYIFLLNDIYLVDLKNLGQLIKGNKFDALLYHCIRRDGSIECLHPNPVALKKPALNPPLRQSLIRAYNVFSDEKITEYGYRMQESNPVGDAYVYNNFPGE